MGLLEDAIREHLDLKRRRGADADEVAQAENDALGPPGRPTPLEETAAAALDPDEALPEADEDEFDDAYEPDEVPASERLDPGEPRRLYDYGTDDEVELEGSGAADEHVDVPAFLAEEAPVAEAEEPATDVAAPAGPYPTSLAEEDDEAPADEVAEPTTEGAEPGAEGLEPADAEPTDLREEPEAEDEAAEGEESEDVLEETPDFLQETPEHDRLWFEQKPPRDFDFGN